MKLTNSLAIAAALMASALTALPTAPSPPLENGHTSTIQTASQESLPEPEEHVAVVQALTPRFDLDPMVAKICKTASHEKDPVCKELHESVMSKRAKYEPPEPPPNAPPPTELDLEVAKICGWWQGDMCKAILVGHCRKDLAKNNANWDTELCRGVNGRVFF